MRTIILCGVLLVSLSLILILNLNSYYSPRVELLIPEDVLGFLVVSNALPNLNFIEHSLLSSNFGLNSENLIRRVPKEFQKQLLALFKEEVKSAWFVVHNLTRKPEGAWKIHFTSLLVPKHHNQKSLQQRTEVMVRNLFGKDNTELREHDGTRIYTGKKTGQILYQNFLPAGLLISNSEKAWNKTLLTIAGKQANLSDKTSFQKIRAHIEMEKGLFVYCNTQKLISLLPEFGYLIHWKGGKWEEKYYEISNKN